MKQRIRIIFILMTVCILCINLFQGYWLYTTYQVNEQHFRRAVRGAFMTALEKQQFAEAQRLFGKKGEDRTTSVNQQGEPDPESDGPDIQRDSLTEAGLRPDGRSHLFNYRFRRRLPAGASAEAMDTLARRISRMLIVDWAGGRNFNIKKIDSTYRVELAQRDIDADFRLDTVYLKKRVRFRMDSLNTRYPITTPPIPLNPAKHQFLQASFDAPTGYILRKMSWLLGGSVLLLGLTTWCFLYMLSTILEQKKLSEIKNDFINNMTHELKTPIATVSAAVEAMQHFGALESPQKTQTYLTISRNELQRLSDLVEKVLNMAVEEKRELALHREWVKPAELIGELVKNQQLKAEKPVTIDVKSEPVNASVQVDRLHISNAISNLIDNAVKYSRDSVQIRIDSRADERGWRLAVQDNGIGISKVYQEAIFDRFFRVPTGNLHPVKGFGLGLSYVRQVVERHGGRIEVSSEPGRGSTFVIWIPR